MPSHASSRIQKVLVANRGEIAVRVIRAAKDAGIPSVAVYAEPDADAPHVRLADEAFALGGQTSAESYLDFGKLLDAASKSGANAIHPGYGFLSENADFAQAVIDAELIWIGPSPQSIRDLGDKVTARHIAAKAKAPLVPGTSEPVKDADEIVAFAKEYGVPIAIKAAFGGGGRGMKVARTIEEIPELFDSATREAVAAFGRGECFVERYLDKPRHVEAQVIADQHGNVVVAGTRDCSLQRRFQKLVEEAPAPFLTDAQRKEIHESAKRICKEAHYYGAGTVEYLVGQDGLISFLEVNTRLQVEHPVTEETSGIDLVRQQFRIANGDALDITEDPTPRGHSIEFRINGEDAGRGFLPAPGPVTKFEPPTRAPASGMDCRRRNRFGDRRSVRLDAGQADRHRRHPPGGAGAVPQGAGRVHRRGPGHGHSFPPRGGVRPGVHRRRQRLHRAHPLDRDRVGQPVEPFTGGDPIDAEDTIPRQTVVVEVGGRRLEVSLPGDLAIGNGGGAAAHGVVRKKPKARKRGSHGGAAASGDAVTAPMQGTVVKVAVEEGQEVAAGDLVVVLEAMKMENPVTAHKDGTITGLAVEAGAAITQGTVLAEIK